MTPKEIDSSPIVMDKRTNKPDERGFIYREAAIASDAIKDGTREMEICFSSEQPVQRFDWRDGKDYMEILSHNPADVDLGRMNNGHPLLVNHDMRDQVGVIKAARIDSDRKGRASVKFSRSARGNEILQDVQDGIRTLVSVGYRVGREVNREQKDGMEYRTFAWTPHEASLVPIPADTSVGVGRSEVQPEEKTAATAAETTPKTEVKTETLKTQIIMETKTETPAPDKRASEILAIAEKYDAFKDARTFISDNKSAEDFMRHILETKFAAKPVNAEPQTIGMNEKETREYSLVKAIRALTTGNWKDAGLERAASDAMAKLTGRETAGFFIPTEASHKRTGELAAGTNNIGKYTVQTNVLGSSLIELLRNLTVAKELGARNLSGLSGNVAIPSQAGGATAYWVAENGQTTASNLTFGQISLTPKRLSAVSAISKQLIAQSSVDVEALVREDFARILAIAIDAAALAGDGSGSSPTGILSTSSIGSVTFGAAATFAKLVDFETQVANANALRGNPAYVVTPNTRAKLKALPKIGTTFPAFVYDNDMINGYKAVATLQVPSDKVIFGNFNDLIIADWVGMDVTVDPYTLADKNQVKLTVNMLADIGVRHAGSFAASTDSGAQ